MQSSKALPLEKVRPKAAHHPLRARLEVEAVDNKALLPAAKIRKVAFPRLGLGALRAAPLERLWGHEVEATAVVAQSVRCRS